MMVLCFASIHVVSISHAKVLSSESLNEVITASTISEPLKNRLPFYHSSQELHMILQEATSSCKGAIASIQQQGPLDVVTIKAPSKQPGKKRQALVVFGEHARELVSAESGLHFVRSLCGLEASSATQAQEVLAGTEFTVVPNANPMGRQLVESGNFCKRTNENGVDLNRNWGDDHRDLLSVSASNVGSYDDDDRKGGEENPGPRGFSEPETQIIKSLAEQLSPDLFLSVHSGAYLLGMPYGFSDSVKPERADEMAHMLEGISQRHFDGNIPYGALARTIGYRTPGTSVDYAAEHLHIPFSFTFEIYAENSRIQKLESDSSDDQENAYGFLKKGALRHLPRVISTSASNQKVEVQSDQSCLSEFNPLSESGLGDVLKSWTNVYLDLAGQVAAAPKEAVQSHLEQSTGPSPEAHAESDSQGAVSASHAETASEYMDINRAREAVLTAPQPQEDSSTVDEEDSAPGSVPWDALKNISDTSGWGVIGRGLLPSVAKAEPRA